MTQYNYIVKLFAKIAIPKLLDEFFTWISNSGEEEPKASPKPVRARKKADTTKLTQHQYDFIIAAHTEYLEWNQTHPRHERKTVQDLADALNERLNLNKSRSAYGSIWNGKVDRSQLPTGEPLI